MEFGPRLILGRSKRPCLFTYSTADNHPELLRRCGPYPACAKYFSLNSSLLVVLSDSVSWFPPPSASTRISLMSPGSSLIASSEPARILSTPGSSRIVLRYVLFRASLSEALLLKKLLVADVGRPSPGKTCLHYQTSGKRISGCRCSLIAVSTPGRPVCSKIIQVGMDVM